MTQDKPEFNLSRRTVLAGLGTIGVASAGAGLGTTAFFNDTESFKNNVITAGKLDLKVSYDASYQGAGDLQTATGTADGDPVVGVNLTDVKPGDWGHVKFCFAVDNNPAYLWMHGALTANDENGQTEPERLVDTTGGDPGHGMGELADAILAEVTYVDDTDSQIGSSVLSGSLRDVMNALSTGVALDGVPGTDARSCFQPDNNPCLLVKLNVPKEVGNEIQTDSVALNVGFYAEQCRHNDGTNNPFATPVNNSTTS